MVNQERLIQTFQELVAIDALSFQERGVAEYLKRQYRDLGIELSEDDAGERIGGNCGNLYGFVFGGETDADTVLFAAHMDTVAPGLGKKAIVQEDGRITSDGTTVLGADDAAGLAVILEALRELVEEGEAIRNIELLFPVAEEAYTIGASAFDISKIKAGRAYVLDCCAEVGAYSAQEPTLIAFRIDVTGKAAHAGFSPEQGINAIAVAAAAIGRIRQGWYNDHTTLNLGKITGGTATNIVSEKVTVEGELRCADHEEALAIYESVVSVFREEADRIGAIVDAEKIIRLTAYRIGDHDESLIKYRKALEKLGEKAIPVKSFGGSDNNVLQRNGIDGLCIYNPMHEIHSCGEYTTVEELIKETQIIKELMRV